jgi:hypothetical protein
MFSRNKDFGKEKLSNITFKKKLSNIGSSLRASSPRVFLKLTLKSSSRELLPPLSFIGRLPISRF